MNRMPWLFFIGQLLFASFSFAAVVNISSGSTSGYTMSDGNTYVIKNSVSFSNSTAGGNGITVADNATVVIYVPANVTPTAKAGTAASFRFAAEDADRLCFHA